MDGSNVLLLVFVSIPIIVTLFALLPFLPGWIRAWKSKQAQKRVASQQVGEDQTSKEKGDIPMKITMGALVEWYRVEGHSIDGITPLNALPTMRDMMEGKLAHTISIVKEVVDPPRYTTKSLQQIPIERRATPLTQYHPDSEMGDNEEEVGKPEEEEEEQQQEPDLPFSLPVPVEKEPVQQPIPSSFKDLARVDHTQFSEQVMEIYTAALQKQADYGKLTREKLGIKKGVWDLLFMNPDGLLRPGFVQDHQEGGFLLDEGPDALARLSTFLQGYHPGKES